MVSWLLPLCLSGLALLTPAKASFTAIVRQENGGCSFLVLLVKLSKEILLYLRSLSPARMSGVPLGPPPLH